MADAPRFEVKPDPAIKKFFALVNWAEVALGHNTQLEREFKSATRHISRVSWNGKSGYKRSWGHFWRSVVEHLRWKNIPHLKARAKGIKYDRPWAGVAGRRSSQFLLKSFRHRKVGQYASFLLNRAGYSGHVLGPNQATVSRRRGWVNVLKAVRWSERVRARITERALLSAARKAGAKT
jgi:hypothetical protein